MTVTDTIIHPDLIEFSIGQTENDSQYVGLRLIHDGNLTTVPLDEKTAAATGRLLVAHVDYLQGKPSRKWE